MPRVPVPDLPQVPQTAIDVLVDEAARAPTVTRLFLFGSRVRGTARLSGDKISDLDVAIETTGANWEEKFDNQMADFAPDWDELEQTLGANIHRMNYAGTFEDGRPVADEVEAYGVLIYARDA